MSTRIDPNGESRFVNERIDRICLDFEDAWQAGDRPDVMDYFEDWTGQQRGLLLRELLLLDLHYRRQAGEEPEISEYLSRFAEHRSVVTEVFRESTAEVIASCDFTAGDQVGRYTVESLLGTGSFGKVYQAWDTDLERRVAIKIPRLEKLGEVRDVDAILEEARMIARLDHPRIVPILDVFRSEAGVPLIVMPFVNGRSLRDKLIEGRPTVIESAELIAELAEAMDYAHRRGVVHRDLEPRNILLDKEGRPHITDFGLALHESTQGAKAGESAGSLAYMSPEQLRGDSHWLDGRSDIWALGVILYEMLTERRPFTGRTFEDLANEIFMREPKPPRQYDGAIPAELEQICLTCLGKVASSRYATARDLAAALKGVLAQLAPDKHFSPGCSRSAVPITSRRRFAKTAILGVAAGLFAIVAGFTVFSRSVRNAPPPTVENIELTVFSEDDTFRGNISRNDASGSPLRTGDRVRLKITLSEPAYLYVLWIGTDGDVTPIYPWEPGKWDELASEAKVKTVTLPDDDSVAWPVMSGTAGAETIVVFCSLHRLARVSFLNSSSYNLQSQSASKLNGPLWFQSGNAAHIPHVGLRAPMPVATKAIADPVFVNIREISKPFNEISCTPTALCFWCSHE